MWFQIKSGLGPRWEILEHTLHQSCPLLEARGWPSAPLLGSHWLATNGGGGGVEPTLKETHSAEDRALENMQVGATRCPHSRPLGVWEAAAGEGTGQDSQRPAPIHTQPGGDTAPLNASVKFKHEPLSKHKCPGGGQNVLLVTDTWGRFWEVEGRDQEDTGA